MPPTEHFPSFPITVNLTNCSVCDFKKNPIFIVHVLVTIVILTVQLRSLWVVRKFRKLDFSDPMYTLLQGQNLALAIAPLCYPVYWVAAIVFGVDHYLGQPFVKAVFFINIGLGFFPALALAAWTSLYRVLVLLRPAWYYAVKGSKPFCRSVLIATVSTFTICAVFVSPMLRQDVKLASIVIIRFNGEGGDAVAASELYLTVALTFISVLAYLTCALLLCARSPRKPWNRNLLSGTDSALYIKERLLRRKQVRVQRKILMISLLSWFAMSWFVFIQLAIRLLDLEVNSSLGIANTLALRMHYIATPLAQFALDSVFRKRFLGMEVKHVGFR